MRVLLRSDLINKGIPIIVHPALWWAPEKIYGVPDLLLHTSCIEKKFPGLLTEEEKQRKANNLDRDDKSGYYIVFDIKFTTKLEDTGKAKDLENYSAQIRIYTYMLGHFQGFMSKKGYLITRDRILNPLPVEIISKLNQPLDDDLRNIRDDFIEIKFNGNKYLPWKDKIVVSNIYNQDERWSTAKKVIAWEKIPGADLGLLYQIGQNAKNDLISMGFPNLQSMLQEDPNDIPFERCKGLGSTKSRQIRAVLQANRSGTLCSLSNNLKPPKKNFEFYVDFEYFTNVNVDFNNQWPNLEGREMIFMVGVGWEDNGNWSFQIFIAELEDQRKELEMMNKFIEFLNTQTENTLIDETMMSLYHWSNAEVWQARRVADRHQLPSTHPLRNLPWLDLQKVFLNSSFCIPGAWKYGLKDIAKALGKIKPEFDPQWPGDLDEGLRAMAMGWKAYQAQNPLQSEEMRTLSNYLEADCKALWKILKWIRSE